MTALPLGDTGRSVAANVVKLRAGRGMTYVELSDRLAHAGRPIPVLGLSRLEAGKRRVDVDDLVALAQVFNMSPSALLGDLPICDICYGAPPAGFSCNACGYSGGAS